MTGGIAALYHASPGSDLSFRLRVSTTQLTKRIQTYVSSNSKYTDCLFILVGLGVRRLDSRRWRIVCGECELVGKLSCSATDESNGGRD